MSNSGYEYKIAGGKYRLVEDLGRGRMSTVWRALDTDDLEVAVKVIPRPTRANQLARFRARFRDEVEAGECLRGPHVCELHDHGELEEAREVGLPNGAFYLVLEYVAGGSLGERLADGPVRPVQEIVELARAVGSGLSTAHEQSPVIVHRDIKPDNILLPSGQLRLAKVADFGIARAEDGTQLTSTGDSVGTYRYMAPEQFLQSSGVTPAADQYSLALVLWECLTGEVPLDEGDFVMTVSARQRGMALTQLQVEGRPAPELSGVLGRALAVSPDDRFSSVAEFVERFGLAGKKDGLWMSESTLPALPQGWSVVADNRELGGALWLVAEGASQDDLARVFGPGVPWRLKENAKAAGGGPAWWTKSRDPNLPSQMDEERLLPSPAYAASDDAMRAELSRLHAENRLLAQGSAGGQTDRKPVRKRNANAAFMGKLTPSPELAAIVGATPLARTEVIKKLWAYIKGNGLQDKKNRRAINADARLRPLFKREQVSMFDLAKVVNKHLSAE